MLTRSDIKFIQSLRLKKFRQEHRLFVAEGIKIVTELVQSSWDLHHIYLTASGMADIGLLAGDRQPDITQVTDKELGRISNQKSPNHALAVVRIPEGVGSTATGPAETGPTATGPAESDPTATGQTDVAPETLPAERLAELAEKGLVLMLDDIQDPGNMGSIIRTADWFGISNIICSPDSVEVYNPKVIQSTMGAFIRVAISYTPLKEVLASKPGIPATGAIMDGENIYETSLPGHGFIIIGNESHGISPGLATDLTKRISIPSSGTGTESLNASVATAVVLAEFYRQGIK